MAASNFLKKVLPLIILILIVGYIINTLLENKAKKDAERAEEERVENEIREEVERITKQTNAIDNWVEKLNKGEQYRINPILTVELEKFWLTDRPILFTGLIKDISSLDSENYIVTIERRLMHNYNYILPTKLELELQCSREKLDDFLDQHPNIFDYMGVLGGIAVFADIDTIETKYTSSSDENERKVGIGKCIELVYTGTIKF